MATASRFQHGSINASLTNFVWAKAIARGRQNALVRRGFGGNRARLTRQ